MATSFCKGRSKRLDSRCHSFQIDAGMLLVRVEAEPVSAENHLRAELGLETLDRLKRAGGSLLSSFVSQSSDVGRLGQSVEDPSQSGSMWRRFGVDLQCAERRSVSLE